MTGLILDAGALIALERRKPAAVALLDRARARAVPLVTSAAVVGQVWRGHRAQAPIAIALRGPHLTVVGLSPAHGRLVGQMLGVTGGTDVVDAHVALLAREREWPVVTSDPDDLHRLDPTLRLHAV
jgi:predicted nucleic acid-binding protein